MASTFVSPVRGLLNSPFLKYGLLIATAVGVVLALFPGFLGSLFRADQFMPHATCYLRNPKVILLHVSSDLLIGIAYVCISVTLGYLIQKASGDIPFHWMFLAFGLFIITCAFTHFMEVWTVWKAVYWLAGYVKLICAVASVATAVALFPLVPKVFALIEEVKISHRRRIDLQRANEELQAFAYSVSHDLRAPLRAVHGMALALTEDYGTQLDPGARVYLERIVGAADRMDHLVRDLLEYSRVSRAEFELEPVNVSDALQEAQAFVAGDAEKAGGIIEVEGTAPLVMASPRILTQVLTNLLGNALKFVGPGVKPRVKVRLESAGETVRVCVIDNGIGIAPEYQQKVFGMFERLHSVSEYPGTGIGLAIVQKAVVRMNGTVTVQSSPGAGSRFCVELKKAGELELARGQRPKLT